MDSTKPLERAGTPSVPLAGLTDRRRCCRPGRRRAKCAFCSARSRSASQAASILAAWLVHGMTGRDRGPALMMWAPATGPGQQAPRAFKEHRGPLSRKGTADRQGAGWQAQRGPRPEFRGPRDVRGRSALTRRVDPSTMSVCCGRLDPRLIRSPPPIRCWARLRAIGQARTGAAARLLDLGIRKGPAGRSAMPGALHLERLR